MSLRPGQVLQDRSRAVRIIKSGGIGSVYEAVDTKLADSPCAVKEILEEASLQDELAEGPLQPEAAVRDMLAVLGALAEGFLPMVDQNSSQRTLMEFPLAIK